MFSRQALAIGPLIQRVNRAADDDFGIIEAMRLAAVLMQGSAAQVLRQAGGAQAIVRLLTIQPATEALPLSVADALGRIDIRELQSFTGPLLKAGAIPAAVALLTWQAQGRTEYAGTSKSGDKFLDGGLKVLHCLTMASADARAALVKAEGAAPGLAAALAVFGTDDIRRTTTIVFLAVLQSPASSRARAAFVSELALPMLKVLHSKSASSQDTAAAAGCLAGMMKQADAPLAGVIADRIAAVGGMTVLSHSLKTSRDPDTIAAVAATLDGVFSHNPGSRTDPRVGSILVPVLVQKLQLFSRIPRPSDDEALLARTAARTLYAVLEWPEDEPPGSGVAATAKAIADAGALRPAAVMCSNPATLCDGAILLTRVVRSTTLSLNQLEAAQPAIVPLLRALKHGPGPVQPHDAIGGTRNGSAGAVGELAAAGLQQQLADAGAMDVLLQVALRSSGGGGGSGNLAGHVLPELEAINALEALQRILEGGESRQNKFVATGGIPRVVCLLLNKQCPAPVVNKACQLLHMLMSGSPAARNAVVGQGGVVSLVRQLERNTDSDNAEAAMTAMLAIRKLCVSSPAVLDAVVQLGGVPALERWSRVPVASADELLVVTKRVATDVAQLLTSGGKVDKMRTRSDEAIRQGTMPAELANYFLNMSV